jgi:hypothetical protein
MDFLLLLKYKLILILKRTQLILVLVMSKCTADIYNVIWRDQFYYPKQIVAYLLAGN